MESKNYLKIVYLAAFVAFAGVSCWATAESLKLLLPSWPVIMCWVVTVGFFIIASFGTKLIADTFNQNIFMEHRGAKLVGGVFIVLVFWLACSMPTNTHTFFYRSFINEKVTSDISMTETYLSQIASGEVTSQLIADKKADLQNNVNVKLGELEAEIKNSLNPGYGPKSEEILKSFADLLGVPSITPLSHRGTSLSAQARQQLYDAYRLKIYALMDSKMRNIEAILTPKNKNHIEKAKHNYKVLGQVRNAIDDKSLSLTDPDDMQTICDKLNDGYNTINAYHDFVRFNNSEDEARYVTTRPETKVRRMLSVFDVWIDFVKGEYPWSFIFWILISVLVDVAAFIFFDIAFKRRDF